MGTSDGLDLLLEQRQVLVGRGQLGPKVSSARRLTIARTAHGILLLLAVLLLLSIWIAGLLSVLVPAAILLLLLASVLIVVALTGCRTDILLGIRVRAPRRRDHTV